MIKKKNEFTDTELLQRIDNKLDLLVLITSLSNKDKKEQVKILRAYNGPFSKRDLERITGIDRHEF